MKIHSMIASGLMLAGIACAGEGAKQCPKHERPVLDSTQKARFKEGHALHKSVFEARKAYFEAYASGKDASARKAELLQAMDKLNEFEKASLEEQAKFFAKLPKDSTGKPLLPPRHKGPGHRPDHDGGPDHKGPGQEGPGMSEGPHPFDDSFAFEGPGLPPPPPEE